MALEWLLPVGDLNLATIHALHAILLLMTEKQTIFLFLPSQSLQQPLVRQNTCGYVTGATTSSYQSVVI